MAARTIVIGDIHGCYDELSALLDKVGVGASDRIIATGDLIVKGAQNRRVLDLFMSDARFSAVLGNHDRALLRYWQGETARLKPKQETCRLELEAGDGDSNNDGNSDGNNDSDHDHHDDKKSGGGRERYRNYLASLPAMCEAGAQHVVVHAGVRPGVALAAQTVEDLTELRTLGGERTSRDGMPWYEVYDGERTVLFGHWPAAAPRRGQRAIGIDTGCVYGYELTAYVIESDEFVQVTARRAYDTSRRARMSWWRRLFRR